MKKLTRNKRVVAITKILMDNPNKIINLNTFTSKFNAAKSTISEDLVIIRQVLSELNMGFIETIPGAAGGIKYKPMISEKDKVDFLNQLCEMLKDKNRIIPGNFIYMTDIVYNPQIVKNAGAILASIFSKIEADCIITVETKGIPLAYEVAKLLGLTLVIARHESKATEGTTISISYVSGSNKRIQTMSLSKKSLKNGSRCIFIDDFMKAGGTALGIIDLLREFNSELVGIGVLIDNIDTPKKLVDNYVSLIEVSDVDKVENFIIRPSNTVL